MAVSRDAPKLLVIGWCIVDGAIQAVHAAIFLLPCRPQRSPAAPMLAASRLASCLRTFASVERHIFRPHRRPATIPQHLRPRVAARP